MSVFRVALYAFVGWAAVVLADLLARLAVVGGLLAAIFWWSGEL